VRLRNQYGTSVGSHAPLGVVTYVDLTANRLRMTEDPAFRSDFNQLADLRDVTSVAVTVAEIREFALYSPYVPGTRRAMVAPTDVAYGLTRIYASYREVVSTEDQILIFRQLKDAEEWLGLPTSDAGRPNPAGSDSSEGNARYPKLAGKHKNRSKTAGIQLRISFARPNFPYIQLEEDVAGRLRPQTTGIPSVIRPARSGRLFSIPSITEMSMADECPRRLSSL